MAETRGRPRKPKEIKIQQGTLRKDREFQTLEAKKLEIVPDYPVFLSEKAGAYYVNISKVLLELSLLSAADNALICQLSIALELNERAYEEIKLNDPVQTSHTGFHTISGWYSIFDKTSKQVRDLCSSFGLSPASRERFTIKEKESEDDLTKLLKRTCNE